MLWTDSMLRRLRVEVTPAGWLRARFFTISGYLYFTLGDQPSLMRFC